MRGWLTPDLSDLSEPEECRSISVPPALWQYVTGALELLTDEMNWEQVGTATAEEITQAFMDLLDIFQQSECVAGGGMQSISTAAELVLSMNQSTHPTYIGTLAIADLPLEAQGATALYCVLILGASSGGDMWVMDGTLARQVITTNGGSEEWQLIVPINNGYATFRLLDEPSTYQLNVYLIGWF